ncbi:hypothetical protein [Leadbetterella sp. DM7]|uniref:hypothetical protein n=1 Tax=Leadbetterella sp. DM7 TaxID=3235085 RepID=UPI00349E8126
MWVNEGNRVTTDIPEEIAAFMDGRRGQNDGDKDDDKKKNSLNSMQLLPIGDISTGLGVVGEGLWTLGEYKSTTLYKEGIRRGVDGNYRLTGRNLSLFGNQPMTEATKPITNLSKLSSAGKYISKARTYLGGASAAIDIFSFATRQSPDDFSGYKLAYNLTGTGSSILVGAKIGGNWRALVGLAFYGGQVGYDAGQKVVNEMKISYNSFKKSITSFWLSNK